MRQSLQGYLAHKKQRTPRALQSDYAYGPMVVLGERAISYQRGNPVECAKAYRGTSLIRNCSPLGPYRRHMPRVLGGSWRMVVVFL